MPVIEACSKGRYANRPFSKGPVLRLCFWKMVSRKSFLVSILILTLAVAWRGSAQESPYRDGEYSEGVRLYDLGDYRSSLEIFRNLFSMDSCDTLSSYYIGLCSYSLGDYPAAMKAFSICVNQSKLSISSHYYLGKALGALGLTSHAIEEEDLALRSDSTFLPARLEILRALCLSGRLREALERLDSSSSADEALIVAGKLAEVHRYEEALSCIKRTRKIDSLSFASGILLGDIYLGLKKYDEAFSIYAHLFLRYKDSPLIARQLAICYGEQGNESGFPIAISLMEKYLALSADTATSDLARIGTWYYEEGRFDSSEVYFRKVVSVDSMSSQAFLNLGLSLYRLGKLAESEEELQTACKLAGTSLKFASSIYKFLGTVKIKRGKYQEAISSYRRALQIDTTDAAAAYNLGQAFDLSGKDDQAIRWYEKCIRINDADSSAVELSRDASRRINQLRDRSRKPAR